MQSILIKPSNTHSRYTRIKILNGSVVVLCTKNNLLSRTTVYKGNQSTKLLGKNDDKNIT